MVRKHRELQTPLAHPPHPCQLGLFDQQGVTTGQVDASQTAVNATLRQVERAPKGTRFPLKAGCALCCNCDRCLNPQSVGSTVDPVRARLAWLAGE